MSGARRHPVTGKKDWLHSKARAMVRVYVAERDGARCHYCRTPFPEDLVGATLDHYVPYSLWPMSKPRNLVLACAPCNNAKADALPLTLAWLLLTADQALYAPAA
ncbi:HNH endonuclease [Streptomyces violaceusniger]|uniref:HNH nuclease n=1 Tax=Streptomyces violaceusniger (strain Tu 4113) TaxID=653045 RepID=G2P7A8_STRV4|nr:HNH endonuclease [Streptomyces violaceusniger]AEM87068.1 HNH nuclease [Streptomyces violaceusniger Tu 4113]